MKRAMLLFAIALWAAALAAHVSTIDARAQCGIDPKTKEAIPCESERQRKAKPTQVPSTATLTPTPEPTETLTPMPTETPTPVPTESATAVAALIVPPPTPRSRAGDCVPSSLGLVAGIVLLGAGGLGYFLSRSGGAARTRWLTFRGADGEGVLPASYRAAGRGPNGESPGAGGGAKDGFAYGSSAPQQQLINTAFGDGSVHPNDRLRSAGPVVSKPGQVLSLGAMLSGASILGAMGGQSAGLISCGWTVPAGLVGAVLGAAAALLLRSPGTDDPDVRYTLFLPDGTPARGSAHVAMKNARKTPSTKGAEGGSGNGDTSSGTEQRQRGRDVFQDLNERARSTGLRATIDVREDPPQDQPPNRSDEADDDTATNGRGEDDT